MVGDDLWVLTAEGGGDRNGAIVVLSPSMETIATYPTAEGLSLLFDGQSVWVPNIGGSTVTRIALDGTVLATIEVEGAPLALGFDGKSIWVPTTSGALIRMSLDGEVLSVLAVGANPVAIAWDGRALWVAHPASPDVFSGTTSRGVVSRLEVYDAPTPASPLASGAEEIAPADADMLQYVLAQGQMREIPGCPGWTDVDSYDLLEFFLEDPSTVALFEGLELQGGLEARGCGPSEGAWTSLPTRSCSRSLHKKRRRSSWSGCGPLPTHCGISPSP